MAASSISIEKLQHTVSKSLKSTDIDVVTQNLVSIAKSIGDDINQKYKIISSNLPGSGTVENKTMVLLVQKKTDSILNSALSPLEKILQCAQVTITYGAGNCQQKSFVALQLLLEEFKSKKLATYLYLPKIEIKFSDDDDGHFYLLVDDKVICDPWAELYYPNELIDENVYGSSIKSFFLINKDWSCYQAFDGGKLQPCPRSTEYTFQLAPKPVFSNERISFYRSNKENNSNGIEPPQKQRKTHF